MALPEYKRRKLCTDQPAPAVSLSPAEYNAAVSVARQLPLLKVEKAFFKVMGERFITPGSLVQFVVKGRIIPPGSVNIPEVDPKDLEDVDPDEGDLDGVMGRRTAGRSRGAQMQNDSTPSSASNTEKPLVPPLAYAPYFPRDHSPRWNIFLADGKMGKIAVPPFRITTFDKPPFQEKDGSPTYLMQSFKMQFQAPPQPGKYSFVMHVVCDSYIGMDSQQDIVLEVESAEKAVEIGNEEDEISEPEEDSLAGQMRAIQSGNLTGGGPSTDGSKRKKIREIESDEDESGTDEEEDSMSETDTETEDED